MSPQSYDDWFETERWDHNFAYRQLAQSIQGHRIVKAEVKYFSGGSAGVELVLDDGRVIQAGVSGGLHDEAYLVFKVAKA